MLICLQVLTAVPSTQVPLKTTKLNISRTSRKLKESKDLDLSTPNKVIWLTSSGKEGFSKSFQTLVACRIIIFVIVSALKYVEPL